MANIPRVRDAILLRRPGKYHCPAHDDRSPSLSISIGDDGRTLLNCFAGCAIDDILDATALSLTDLFVNSHKHRPIDKEKREFEARVQRGREIVETWRESELRQCCELLRRLYSLVRCAKHVMQFIEQHNPSSTDEIAWDVVAFAYPCISLLEHRFDRLNSRDPEQHLDAYEEEHRCK